MPTGAVERDAGFEILGAIPEELAEMAVGLLGEPAEIKDELNRVNRHMHTFYELEPDMVLRLVSAYAARVVELERLLFYAESRDRTYARIRTMDARPLMEGLELQFKIHSRLLESRAQDMALQGVRR